MDTKAHPGNIRPLVSVIIVNTNELHHLRRCLPAITRQSYPCYEVLVVDNASSDGSIGYIKEHFPEVQVIESATNLGYAGANNLGFKSAQGLYCAVLNPDTEADHNWLGELIKA